MLFYCNLDVVCYTILQKVCSMNPNYRLIQQVESTKFEKSVCKKDNSYFAKFQSRYKGIILFFCICVFILFSGVYSSYAQNPSSLLNDCSIDTTWQLFEMDSTNLFPDWMTTPFREQYIKQRHVRNDRIEIEIKDSLLNNYTLHCQIWPGMFLTGLDNTTIKEYLTIYVLDSIAKTIPVFSDPDSILELVLFQKDTCSFEQKCRIGIYDSIFGNQHFTGGVCCTHGDQSSFETVAGMPILTDSASGIRYIEYWYKKRCMENLVCCEIVYQYKSNNDSTPKFVFFDGPTKRMHYQRSCFYIQSEQRHDCPDSNPEENIDRRTCKSCQTPIHED
jgi:hypothetical protein